MCVSLPEMCANVHKIIFHPLRITTTFVESRVPNVCAGLQNFSRCGTGLGSLFINHSDDHVVKQHVVCPIL